MPIGICKDLLFIAVVSYDAVPLTHGSYIFCSLMLISVVGGSDFKRVCLGRLSVSDEHNWCSESF